jgi:hypothetical protein
MYLWPIVSTLCFASLSRGVVCQDKAVVRGKGALKDGESDLVFDVGCHVRGTRLKDELSITNQTSSRRNFVLKPSCNCASLSEESVSVDQEKEFLLIPTLLLPTAVGQFQVVVLASDRTTGDQFRIIVKGCSVHRFTTEPDRLVIDHEDEKVFSFKVKPSVSATSQIKSVSVDANSFVHTSKHSGNGEVEVVITPSSLPRNTISTSFQVDDTEYDSVSRRAYSMVVKSFESLHRMVTFLLALTVFPSALIGQEDVQNAQTIAKNYTLDADFVFARGVLQIAEIDVETSADAPLLYTSKIYTQFFKGEEFSSEFFHSVATIVSDDRLDTSVAGPPGSRNEFWKRLYTNNGAYDLFGPDLEQLKVPRQVSPAAGSLRWGSCVPEPFEWPFFLAGSLRKDGFGKKAYKEIFCESHECVGAKTTHHGLESEWVRKDRTGKAVHRYKFRNDRLEVFEIFYFVDGFDVDRQQASDGSLLLRTETKWEIVDGDPYPSEMSSIQYNSPFLGQYTRYKAKIKCFASTSSQYRDEEKYLRNILEKIELTK